MSAIQLHGVDKVIRNISNLPKQVRFATAQAINATAKEAQQKTLSDLLPSKFTLRSKGAPWQKPGGKFGFNIRPFATRDSLTATLGSQADWLSLQEKGGVKRIQGHRIAIPSPFWKQREEIMARAKKPAALLKQWRKAKAAEQSAVRAGAKARTTRQRGSARVAANTARKRAATIASLANAPFLVDQEGGKLRPGIYVRTGESRLPIQRLFKFVDSARIDTKMEWEKNATEIVNQRFDHNFRVALARALATAK